MMELLPGDVLLYHTNSLMGWLIRLKTWSTINHCETYLGGGMSAAARGEGVNSYPLRTSGLAYVLRPHTLPSFGLGVLWHLSCIGQPYDWVGLFKAFFSPNSRGNIGKQWCSEHTARMAKKSGYYPFGLLDSEKVSPSLFLSSPAYKIYTPDGAPYQPPPEHDSL